MAKINEPSAYKVVRFGRLNKRGKALLREAGLKLFFTTADRASLEHHMNPENNSLCLTKNGKPIAIIASRGDHIKWTMTLRTELAFVKKYEGRSPVEELFHHFIVDNDGKINWKTPLFEGRPEGKRGSSTTSGWRSQERLFTKYAGAGIRQTEFGVEVNPKCAEPKLPHPPKIRF